MAAVGTGRGGAGGEAASGGTASADGSRTRGPSVGGAGPGTAVVTGANGFIGSHLVLRLVHRGWTVHALGRSRGGIPWRERVRAALRQASGEGAPDPPADALRFHEADLSRPDLGARGFPGLRPGGGAVLVHLAGDTRFLHVDPEEQRRVNVDGTLHAVGALAPLLGRVVHVSTAFVAGDRAGTILEGDGDLGQGFHNHYERTKLEAEGAVARLCGEAGLPLSIARPAIVVNHARTGASSAFTHFNAMVEVVNRIQEHYGIRDGEAVSREIRVRVDPRARPDMAPVDPVAEALAVLAESGDAGGTTFHLGNPAPPANSEILGLAMEAFGVAGKARLVFVEELRPPLSRTEEMIARSFRAYLPYLNERRTFDLTNTRRLVPGYDALFAPMDLGYLRRVIAFERANRR